MKIEFFDKINILKSFLNKIIESKYAETFGGLHNYFEVGKSGASSQFIEKLLHYYPFLPDNYVNLISKYDGLEISWVRFLGSENSSWPCIFDEIEDLEIYTPKGMFCPIGLNSCGDIIALKKDLSVVEIINDSNEIYTIAINFDDFMNNQVLGKGILKFISRDNTFYKFLVDQGWD